MTKRRICVFLMILFLLGITLITVFNNISYNKYLSEYNKNIYEIIGKIKEKYPDVTEEELIEVLNGKEDFNNIKEGKDILKKYGIKESDPAILNLKEIYEENLVFNYLVLLIIIILVFIIFIIYKYYENKQKKEITNYIRQINNKNYELKIEKNREDEYTNLRNELYKITLMLKEQAENSEKDKVNLAKSLSDISHQIKTPLTSISIMIDEIKENRDMDEQTKSKFIFEISRQIEQINFLTISLLKLSKLDADAVVFENKKINLNKLINEVIENLEIPLEIKNLNIKKEIKDKIYILGDYRWILEAITNIVKNCIEHTKEGKSIYITINNKNIYIELVIKDEGEGIDKEDLKNIFERFYKGKNSSDNSFGIGLSLSKLILEKQGASIDCYSEKSKGTTFKIRWIK